MFEATFSSLYADSGSVMSSVTTSEFLICCLTSILLGAICGCIYMFKHKYSKNFVVTLALLPLIVQMVITLVNGNLGAGIAVMGVFNLVRFRSIPGTAKDIASVFLAMAIGLATGMGYIWLAVLFTIIVGIVNVVLVLAPFGKPASPEMACKITVPEDLEYDGMFDTIFDKYTTDHSLRSVSTSNMGSLYKLEYNLQLKDMSQSKALLDELRVMNGNLKISLGYAETREGL